MIVYVVVEISFRDRGEVLFAFDRSRARLEELADRSELRILAHERVRKQVVELASHVLEFVIGRLVQQEFGWPTLVVFSAYSASSTVLTIDDDFERFDALVLRSFSHPRRTQADEVLS